MSWRRNIELKSSFLILGQYPCEPSFSIPAILRNLIYPTNHNDAIYNNYDVNNFFAAANTFIHGNVG